MKKQKKIIVSIVAVILITGIVLIGFYVNKNMNNPSENNETNEINNTNTEIPDPAGFICNELGYKIQVVTDKEGGQRGVCIFPDKTECGEWAFYAGLCGQNWSYCEQNGYDLITKNDGNDSYSPVYSVCIDKNTKIEIGSVSKLMNLGERLSNPMNITA
jgi:putative hemolysin